MLVEVLSSVAAGLLVYGCYVAYYMYPTPMPGQIPYDPASLRRMLGDIPGVKAEARRTGENTSAVFSVARRLGEPLVQLLVTSFQAAAAAAGRLARGRGHPAAAQPGVRPVADDSPALPAADAAQHHRADDHTRAARPEAPVGRRHDARLPAPRGGAQHAHLGRRAGRPVAAARRRRRPRRALRRRPRLRPTPPSTPSGSPCSATTWA